MAKEPIIKIADTRNEIKQAFRVRYEVFCLEMEFDDPSEFPDGMERDAFDNRAQHIVAIMDGQVVATARVVYYEESQPFYSEQLGIKIPEKLPRHLLAEASRGAILKQYRGQAGIVFRVINRFYQECKQNNVKYLLTVAHESMCAIYRKIQIPIAMECEPVICSGYPSIPLIFAIKNDYSVPIR